MLSFATGKDILKGSRDCYLVSSEELCILGNLILRGSVAFRMLWKRKLGGFLLCCMVDAYMYLHAHVAIKATIGMGSISVALLSAVLGRVRVYSPRHGWKAMMCVCLFFCQLP